MISINSETENLSKEDIEYFQGIIINRECYYDDTKVNNHDLIKLCSLALDGLKFREQNKLEPKA